jgi:small subunit ribosomal protein S16
MRIVVIDSRKSSISNRYTEKIGWWIPAEHTHSINKERALYWISKGAKPSSTIHNLLIEDKIIEGSKIPKHNHSDKAIEAKNKKDNPVAVVVEEVKPEPATEEVKTEEVKEEPVEETKVEEIKEEVTE